MNKVLVLVLTVVLFGVVGCTSAQALAEDVSPASVASAEQATRLKLATSLEDVVGIWQGVRGGGGLMEMDKNGAWTLSYSVEDRALYVTADVRFEGSQFFITETSYGFIGENCADTGIYEIQRLADDNLRFVVISDECARRVTHLQGNPGIDVEWKPIPFTSAEPITQPKLATSLQDVMGTWKGIHGGGGLMEMDKNGAWLLSYSVEDRALYVTADVRFEGTQFFITETTVGFIGENCEDTGIYEIQRLADGNLKFVAISDECARRVTHLQGDPGIDVEWKPLPSSAG